MPEEMARRQDVVAKEVEGELEVLLGNPLHYEDGILVGQGCREKWRHHASSALWLYVSSLPFFPTTEVE